jgi:hypothetical protein
MERSFLHERNESTRASLLEGAGEEVAYKRADADAHTAARIAKLHGGGRRAADVPLEGMPKNLAVPWDEIS